MTTIQTTYCDQCLKDRIYVMEDDDGICIYCKNLIKGPIVGGISYYEYMRLKGENPDLVDAGLAAEKLDESIEKIDPKVKSLDLDEIMREVGEKVKVVAKVVEPSKTEKITKKDGPGVLARLKNAFKTVAKTMGEAAAEAKKGWNERSSSSTTPSSTAKAPEKNHEKTVPKPSESVKTPPATVTSPSIGDTWVVGPCISCYPGQQRRFVGRVVTEGEFISVMGRPRRPRFVYIRTKEGMYAFGCAICSNRM